MVNLRIHKNNLLQVFYIANAGLLLLFVAIFLGLMLMS
jgi:hypothetical protein